MSEQIKYDLNLCKRLGSRGKKAIQANLHRATFNQLTSAMELLEEYKEQPGEFKFYDIVKVVSIDDDVHAELLEIGRL